MNSDHYEAYPHCFGFSSEGISPGLKRRIDHATKEEIRAELRRLYTLRLLHRTGGINLNEDSQFREGKARLLEERDVPNILEALFTEEFYSKYPEHMRKHLTRMAKKGLDKYSNILVVERDEKAVCRAVVDTPYPPYAEVGVDPVHPEYTGKEEDIWTELIEGSISLAKQFGCNITYAMEFKNSPSARLFYQKYGAPAYRVYSKFRFSANTASRLHR